VGGSGEERLASYTCMLLFTRTGLRLSERLAKCFRLLTEGL
jgi:hypothetical protein